MTWFPPHHPPKMHITEMKADTLGRTLFNYHDWLRQWDPDKPFECTCSTLPGDRAPNGHVACPAADSLQETIYSDNMGDGRWVT